mgnify:FL=1
MKDIRARLRNWVWNLAKGEARAAGVAKFLLTEDLLTREERDFVSDVLYPDELVHLRRMKTAARIVSPTPLSEIWIGRTAGLSPFGRLCELNYAEGLLVKRAPWVRTIVASVDTDLLPLFTETIKDECIHFAWGKRVIRRIQVERGHEIPQITSFDRLEAELRLIYETVLQSEPLERPEEEGRAVQVFPEPFKSIQEPRSDRQRGS